MNKQTVLIFVLIFSLAVTAFIWLSYGKKEKEPVTDNQATDLEARFAELQRLKELELDTAILEDSVFQKLGEPENTPALSETAGRKNPFSPF